MRKSKQLQNNFIHTYILSNSSYCLNYVSHLRGGSRGRVQGVRSPPTPRDDLRFSNTTGILPKKKNSVVNIGVEVEQDTSAPPPKKILDPPLHLVHDLKRSRAIIYNF